MLTKALVDHHALTVTFRGPQLNTGIQSEKENPLNSLPSLTPSSSTSNVSLSVAPITCLLTGMPTLDQPHGQIQLQKGLNLVMICVTLTAALTGSVYLASVIRHQKTKCCPRRPIDP